MHCVVLCFSPAQTLISGCLKENNKIALLKLILKGGEKKKIKNNLDSLRFLLAHSKNAVFYFVSITSFTLKKTTEWKLCALTEKELMHLFSLMLHFHKKTFYWIICADFHIEVSSQFHILCLCLFVSLHHSAQKNPKTGVNAAFLILFNLLKHCFFQKMWLCFGLKMTRSALLLDLYWICFNPWLQGFTFLFILHSSGL